ncbi:MAG: hypothetical protein ACK4IS_03805 [Erythrobacter sp.]
MPTPEPRRITPAVGGRPPSRSWARQSANSPGEKRVALTLSCLLTAGIFSLIFLASLGPFRDSQTTGERLVLTAIELARPIPPEPLDEADGVAAGSQGSPRETAQATAPVTIAPISALPVAMETIRTAPLALPKASVANEALASTASRDAQSFQAQFARQASGAGGEEARLGKGSGSGAGSADGAGALAAGQQRIIYVASWAPSMDFSKGREFYPPAAVKAGIEGVGVLRCLAVRRDRVRDCKLIEESPKNHGFGEAALKSVPHLRIRLHDQNGRRVYNEWVTVSNWFDLADETRQQFEASASKDAALASTP